jgi:hypothetical protein
MSKFEFIDKWQNAPREIFVHRENIAGFTVRVFISELCTYKEIELSVGEAVRFGFCSWVGS